MTLEEQDTLVVGNQGTRYVVDPFCSNFSFLCSVLSAIGRLFVLFRFAIDCFLRNIVFVASLVSSRFSKIVTRHMKSEYYQDICHLSPCDVKRGPVGSNRRK